MFGGGPSSAVDEAAYSSTGCPQPHWPVSRKVSRQSPILELMLRPTRSPFSRTAWQAGCARGTPGQSWCLRSRRGWDCVEHPPLSWWQPGWGHS